MKQEKLKRIAIIGLPGSGKSTFANELGNLLDVPVHHLDKHRFEKNGKKKDKKEFLEIQKTLLNEKSWIIEGCSSSTFNLRFAKADILIYFCLSRFVCIWRTFKRSFTKRKIDSGCVEVVNWPLLKYTWKFEKEKGKEIKELIRKHPSLKVYTFSKPKEVRDFLTPFKIKKTKYSFKPYLKIFPKLFLKEKKRLLSYLKTELTIEHVGSTSIPNLGGKGIIDIAIAVDQKNIERTLKKLQTIGYEFKPDFSSPNRFYFIGYLPDPKEEKRRYHIHLTHLESNEWRELIDFRDYLRSHPKDVLEYEELKKQAASNANQDGEVYRKMKEPIFKKINSSLNKN